MPTPHISANPGDFAPAVLMPGDPRRAQRIAEMLFGEPQLVTEVRGMLGFTGKVNDQPLSVMGSGMGQPSIGIYATELFKFYGVERIIRVGTCGGLPEHVKVGDTVIAMGAHTDSNYNEQRIPGVAYAPTAAFPLVRAAAAAAGDDPRVHVGTIISRDHFYETPVGQNEGLAAYGVLGVEMESAALFAAAAQYGKQAASILTVSDHLFDSSTLMSAQERETKFQTALKLALAAAFC